jgi:hypothetical protein
MRGEVTPMGILKFVLWTSVAVGLGIFLASFPLFGKTPLEHAQRAWKTQGSGQVAQLKAGLGDALEEAKDVVSSDKKIRERHSPEDREEVNQLISKRAARK